MTSPTTINGWIGYCYAADLGKRLPAAISAFADWLKVDPANIIAARAARQSDQAVLKRDYVSKAFNSYIDAALTEEPNA